ncbi:hypothetical protein [Cutibacterium sp.]|uniref:hypothetical protein n=1 Tax=Cutibacterium sp. TaxID=1912221 RepID=UPI0026DB5D25|nr:hypothetical protein [Cutibacterium sp.]MDO4412904.1 hypothetical protein [Cutibacterium sp.]
MSFAIFGGFLRSGGLAARGRQMMWRERPRIVIPCDARDGRSGDLITGTTTRVGTRNTDPSGSTLA